MTNIHRPADVAGWLTLLLSTALLLAADGPRHLRLIAVRTLEQARQVQEQFRDGEPFELLARQHSVDPSAARGGFLGFISLDRLNAQFREAASGLQPGEMSNPFQSGPEWVLLYRMKRDFPARVAALQEKGDREREQGNLKGALQAYQRAILLNPDYAHGYFSAGVAYGLLDQPDKEKEYYRKALRLAPDLAPAQYNLARLYAAQGDPYSAVAAFRKVVEIKPDHAEAHVNLSALQLALGDRAAALKSAGRAVEINPLLASAHYNLGLAQSASDLESALSSFRLAATLDPSQLDAAVNAAVALARLGRVREAKEEVRRLLQQHPDFEPARQLQLRLEQMPAEEGPASAGEPPREISRLRARVEQLIAARKFPEALARLQPLLEDNPEDPDIRRLAARTGTAYGSLLFTQGRFQSAAELWRQAVKLQPDLSAAWLGLARVAIRRGAFQSAESFIGRAADLEPENPDVVLVRARLQYERRNFQTAHELLAGLQVERLTPPRLLELTSILLDLDLDEEALGIIRSLKLKRGLKLQFSHLLADNALYDEAQALLAGDTSPAASLRRADIYLRRLQFEAAEPILDRLLRQGFRPWQTRMLLGKLYVDSGRAERAVQVFEEAVELRPEDVNGILQLALACRQSGRREAAVKWLRRGLQLEPESDRMQFELGKLLVQMERRAEALTLLLQVVARQPDHPRAHYVLGNLYRQMGDLQAAQRHLERFRSLQKSLRADRRALREKKAALKQPEL